MSCTHRCHHFTRFLSTVLLVVVYFVAAELLSTVSVSKGASYSPLVTYPIFIRTRNELYRVSPSGERQLVLSGLNYGNNVEIVNDLIYVDVYSGTGGPNVTLAVYTLDGELVRTIPMPPNGDFLFVGITVLPDGRIAWLDNLNDRVLFTDGQGIEQYSVPIAPWPDNSLQDITGIVVGGNLVVSEDGHARIIAIDLTTRQTSVLRDYSPEWPSPAQGLGAITHYGGSYYLIANRSSIVRFSETERLSLITTLPGYNGTGIVVRGGYAYVPLNFANAVYRIDLATGTYTTFLSDIDYPVDIALASEITFGFGGHVLDDKSAPVPYVTLVAGGVRTTTGPDGAYRIDGLVPGQYEVRPQPSGRIFAPAARTVALPDDQKKSIDFIARFSVGPFLSLPVNYGDLLPAEAAQGNFGSAPGKVNSWFDHHYPDGGNDRTVVTWSGWPHYGVLDTDNCTKGLSCYDGHEGIDFARGDLTDTTTAVISAAAGKVARVDWDATGYGNYVVIDHENGYFTLYGHLAAVKVERGMWVNQGFYLGPMGSTGNSTAPHLHFSVFYDQNGDRLWDRAERVDPYGYQSVSCPFVDDPWPANGGTPSKYLWKFPLSNTQRTGVAAKLRSPTGLTTLAVPSGATTTPVTLQLVEGPVAASPFASLRSTGRPFDLSVLEWRTACLSAAAALDTTFRQPLTAVINLGPKDLTHLDGAQLSLCRWNPESEHWEIVPAKVDLFERAVTAQITRPGQYDLQAPLSCPNDTSEPDDDFYQATPLTTSLSVKAFDSPSDEDWYTFVASEGTAYDIRLADAASGVSGIFAVYASDGSKLAVGEDNNELLWTAPTTGTYFLQVRPAPGSKSGCTATYVTLVLLASEINPDQFRLYLPYAAY